MKQTFTWKQKLRQLLSVMLPVLITQISLSAMNFFDTTMSGHASRQDLAGVAIGSNLWLPVYTGLTGVLLAVMPMVAQLHGARRPQDMAAVVVQGLYLAGMLAVVTTAAGWLVLPAALQAMGLEAEVQRIAFAFLGAISLGMAPLFAGSVLRCFIDALGYTRITMLVTLGALPINIALNYALIFGHFGFPKLGGVGAGYASAVTYWLILLAAFWVVYRLPPFCRYGIFEKWQAPSPAMWKEQLRLGLPLGTAIFCETSIFGVVAVFMAAFGTLTIAAHQAAINFAGLVYMLPLSMSMALTIVVGFEVGAGRWRDARQYAVLGVAVALVAALFCALGLWAGNEQVAALYTKDESVLQLTREFLLYAAFFQLSDAVAAPIQGILRGYKEVIVPFMVALVSYWGLALPVGMVLSNTSWGPFGYWVGFIVGLAAGAVALALRLRHVQRLKANSAL